MENDTASLARHFRDISDRELLHRCSTGNLTDVARSVAYAKLISRGLALPGTVNTAPDASEPYEGDFETVAQFFNPIDAFLLAGSLEAAGIPPVVADSNLVQLNSLWAIAVGGIRIRVPAARVAEAREVIAAFQRGDFALPDDDESYRE